MEIDATLPPSDRFRSPAVALSSTPAAILTSAAVWTLIALHGSYGLVWLLKEATLPDPGWRRHVTIAAGLTAFFAVLFPYWVIGWVLLSGWSAGVQSLPALAAITALHTVGVALMIGADAQKTATLRHRPGLITDGFFARIRHPNYLGEMMIYGSYALVVWHWLPVVILGLIWGVVFAANIAAKERRLARHPGWAAYKARTGLLWPGRGR